MPNSNPPYGISVQINNHCQQSSRLISQQSGSLYIDLGWLSLKFTTRENLAKCFHADENALAILDGYLTEPKSLSDIVVNLIKGDTNFINHLTGSFFLCLILPEQKKAYFITDRRNSRSYYRFSENNKIIISSRVDHIARQLDKISLTLNAEAAAQYLIRGAFYGTHTLFDSITKIPAATLLTYENQTLSHQDYWRLAFASDHEIKLSEQDLIEEGFQIIKSALEKSLAQFSSPILFLSGGVDSRLILGALKHSKLNRDIEAITWGKQPIQKGDDLDIAVRLAEASNISHQLFEIASENFHDYLCQAIFNVDCRVDVLDAPSLSHLWKNLGNSHDAFINGDEWFGWHDKAPTVDDAVDKVGWWNLDKVSRIADWINPDKKKDIKLQLGKTLQNLVDKTQTINANDIKDSLYYYERIGNMLNSQLISKLPFMHPIQPLLAEDVIEFVAQIPQHYRYDKKLLRLILQQKFPKLENIPYASVKALPTGTTLQERALGNQALMLFLKQELFEQQNKQLSLLLDFKKIQAVYDSIYNNTPLPAIDQTLLQSIPFLWRYLPKTENRVHPMIAILRVLALNVYLNQIGNKQHD